MTTPRVYQSRFLDPDYHPCQRCASRYYEYCDFDPGKPGNGKARLCNLCRSEKHSGSGCKGCYDADKTAAHKELVRRAAGEQRPPAAQRPLRLLTAPPTRAGAPPLAGGIGLSARPVAGGIDRNASYPVDGNGLQPGTLDAFISLISERLAQNQVLPQAQPQKRAASIEPEKRSADATNARMQHQNQQTRERLFRNPAPPPGAPRGPSASTRSPTKTTDHHVSQLYDLISNLSKDLKLAHRRISDLEKTVQTEKKAFDAGKEQGSMEIVQGLDKRMKDELGYGLGGQSRPSSSHGARNVQGGTADRHFESLLQKQPPKLTSFGKPSQAVVPAAEMADAFLSSLEVALPQSTAGSTFVSNAAGPKPTAASPFSNGTSINAGADPRRKLMLPIDKGLEDQLSLEDGEIVEPSSRT